MPPKFSMFTSSKGTSAVTFVESYTVKEGVVCDTYTFDNDPKRDLAVVRVAKGHATPLQRVLKGDETIEGYLSGKGVFMVAGPAGMQSYHLHDAQPTEFVVKIGSLCSGEQARIATSSFTKSVRRRTKTAVLKICLSNLKAMRGANDGGVAAVRKLAQHGASEPQLTVRLWLEGEIAKRLWPRPSSSQRQTSRQA